MCYVLNLGHIFLKSSIVITYNINKFTYLLIPIIIIVINIRLIITVHSKSRKPVTCGPVAVFICIHVCFIDITVNYSGSAACNTD